MSPISGTGKAPPGLTPQSTLVKENLVTGPHEFQKDLDGEKRYYSVKC